HRAGRAPLPRTRGRRGDTRRYGARCTTAGARDRSRQARGGWRGGGVVSPAPPVAARLEPARVSHQPRPLRRVPRAGHRSRGAGEGAGAPRVQAAVSRGIRRPAARAYPSGPSARTRRRDRAGPRRGAAAGRLRRIIGGSQGGRARTPARGARGKDDRLRPTAGHGALPDAPAPRPPPRGGDGRAGLVREGGLGEGGRAPRIRAASAGCSPSPLGARNGRPDRNRYLERGAESPGCRPRDPLRSALEIQDRKSTRLNSSHVAISYAVFCLKKKTTSPALTARARSGGASD